MDGEGHLQYDNKHGLLYLFYNCDNCDPHALIHRHEPYNRMPGNVVHFYYNFVRYIYLLQIIKIS